MKLIKVSKNYNRFKDGGKIVSLTHRSRSTLQKHFYASGTQLC
jgi:hypothetical protein